MNLTLQVWRQKDARSPGRFVGYEAHDISPDMSFLEMLDVVHERLVQKGEDPIAFDHDRREGICGTCGVSGNGSAHARSRPAPRASRSAGSACAGWWRPWTKPASGPARTTGSARRSARRESAWPSSPG